MLRKEKQQNHTKCLIKTRTGIKREKGRKKGGKEGKNKGNEQKTVKGMVDINPSM